MMRNRIFAAAAISLILPFGSVSADPLDYLCKHCRSASVVTDSSDLNQAVTGLQKAFSEGIGEGQVKACSLVIQENFGEGFSAFGGMCKVDFAGKTTQWMICYDNGVGNFSAVMGARWWRNPKLFLAQFTDSNCVGG